MLAYSRNCRNWEPVREQRRFGDALEMSTSSKFFYTVWKKFPYPFRAQCVRFIPVDHHLKDPGVPEGARFIGCSTGKGI